MTDLVGLNEMALIERASPISTFVHWLMAAQKVLMTFHAATLPIMGQTIRQEGLKE